MKNRNRQRENRRMKDAKIEKPWLNQEATMTPPPTRRSGTSSAGRQGESASPVNRHFLVARNPGQPSRHFVPVHPTVCMLAKPTHRGGLYIEGGAAGPEERSPFQHL